MTFRRFCALFLLIAVVAGCNNEANRTMIDKRTGEATKLGTTALEPTKNEHKKSYNPLVVTDKVWLGNASMRLRSGLPLPGKYEAPRGVTMIVADPLPLAEIASALGAQTGIPIRITTGPGSAMAPTGTMPVAYEGPLSGLLDLIAGHYGLNWRYDGASINFSRFATRVFTIEALPGTMSIKDGMKEDSDNTSNSSSTTGSSSSGTSSLMQSTEVNVEMKVWEELEATVRSMLGGTGTVVAAPSTGTLTVTTTPDLMRVVAKFLEEENARMSRQIAINVEVYTVVLESGSDFQVAFTTALDRLKDIGFNVTGAKGPTSSTVASAGQLSMAILNPRGIGTISNVFSALSSIGDTTRVAQFPMTTLNNRPVSRRIGRDRSYVRELSNSDSTTSSFSSSTITPGTIREGFSLQLTPRLLEDGRIMLQYSFSLIDIVTMRTFNTGAGSVELPETSSRIFVQQSLLKSGSTLILAGYDDEQTSQSSQGMGNPYNYFLGGGNTNTKSHTMMYIAITPQVLDVPAATEEAE